jgi:RNA-directed DNA polymerase
LESVIAELNLRLPGWVRYFRMAAYKTTFRDLDSWIRHKLRCVTLKHLKKKRTIAKTLMAMGVKEYQAWILASSGKGWWRLSGAPQVHEAMNLAWFKNQGLISLEELYLSL